MGTDSYILNGKQASARSWRIGQDAEVKVAPCYGILARKMLPVSWSKLNAESKALSNEGLLVR